jgi:hypothetical protein
VDCTLSLKVIQVGLIQKPPGETISQMFTTNPQGPFRQSLGTEQALHILLLSVRDYIISGASPRPLGSASRRDSK